MKTHHFLAAIALTCVFLQTSLAGTPLPELRATMISLGVKDPARSVKFYHETLGLPIDGEPGEVTLIRAGGIAIVLNQPAGLATKGDLSGAVEIVFPVPSVEKAYKQLRDAGCKFVNKPHETTPGTLAASFADPDGHTLTILGPK